MLAYGLFSVGAFVSLLNFHLSFIRPLIRRRRGQEDRFVSGLPAIGSLMLGLSFFCFPPDHPLKWVAVVIALFDTGGLHWFCGMILWRAYRRLV